MTSLEYNWFSGSFDHRHFSAAFDGLCCLQFGNGGSFYKSILKRWKRHMEWWGKMLRTNYLFSTKKKKVGKT